MALNKVRLGQTLAIGTTIAAVLFLGFYGIKYLFDTFGFDIVINTFFGSLLTFGALAAIYSYLGHLEEERQRKY